MNPGDKKVNLCFQRHVLSRVRSEFTFSGSRYFVNFKSSLEKFVSNFICSMTQMSGPEAAKRLINFINASPTPFHAVHNAAIRLEKAGFIKVRDSQSVRTSADDGLVRSKRKIIGRIL